MSGPFIFIATNRLKPGALEAEKRRVPQLCEFIEATEPRMLAFNEYVDDNGSEVAVVQVHPDARVDGVPHGRRTRASGACVRRDPRFHDQYSGVWDAQRRRVGHVESASRVRPFSHGETPPPGWIHAAHDGLAIDARNRHRSLPDECPVRDQQQRCVQRWTDPVPRSGSGGGPRSQ